MTSPLGERVPVRPAPDDRHDALLIALTHPADQDLGIPFDSETGDRFAPFLERDLVLRLLEIFYSDLYCLMPFPDQSRLMRDFHSRRETHPGGEEWTAMLLTLVAVTTCLGPSRTGLSRDVALRLIEDCRGQVEKYLQQLSHQPTIYRSEYRPSPMITRKC